MKNTNSYQSLKRSTIDNYVHGTDTDRAQIEATVENSFEQDALDGWKESGFDTSRMAKLDTRFLKNGKTVWTKTILIGTAIAAATIISTFYLQNEKDSSTQNHTIALTVDQTDLQLPEGIDTLELLPKNEQITIKTIIQEQQQREFTKSQPVNATETNYAELPVTVLEPLPVAIREREVTVSKQKNGKEIILQQLKAIDYSAYRSKPTVSIEQIILTGTPADQEKNGVTNETASEVRTIQIPYMDYLEKTLNLTSRGKWKQALTRWEEILTAFPDDVNARFYAGLCYYNLQQYANASTNFSSCLQLEFSNFNEEASWYLAQSYLSNGQKNEALQLFKLIREQRGFYSKQAEKVIKEWK